VTLHVLQTNSQKLAGGDDNTPDTDENIPAQTVSRCLHSCNTDWRISRK